MTWFASDDGLMSNEKFLDAVDEGGPTLMALWLSTGTMCAKINTDGLVPRRLLAEAALKAHVTVDTVVPVLVRHRIWHDNSTLRRCTRCKAEVAKLSLKKLPDGAYYWHDWFPDQLSKKVAKTPEERWKDNRRKELYRSVEPRRSVVERDGHSCRYCGQRVKFSDGVSRNGGTYDHRDPDGPNTIENVVVACRGCNSDKGHRTPEEWVAAGGRTLLDPPGSPSRPDLGPDLTPAEVATQAGPTPSRAGAHDSGRVGLGEVGPGSPPSPDLGPPAPAFHGNGSNGHHHEPGDAA